MLLAVFQQELGEATGAAGTATAATRAAGRGAAAAARGGPHGRHVMRRYVEVVQAAPRSAGRVGLVLDLRGRRRKTAHPRRVQGPDGPLDGDSDSSTGRHFVAGAGCNSQPAQDVLEKL